MIWAWFIAGIVGAPLTLVSHELCHAVFIKLSGGKITIFKPWPHRFEGRWRFGAVWGMWGYGRKPLYRFSHVAPLVKACTLFVAWFSLAFVWEPLLMLGFWEITDISKWIIDYGDGHEDSDAQKWKRR